MMVGLHQNVEDVTQPLYCLAGIMSHGGPAHASKYILEVNSTCRMLLQPHGLRQQKACKFLNGTRNANSTLVWAMTRGGLVTDHTEDCFEIWESRGGRDGEGSEGKQAAVPLKHSNRTGTLPDQSHTQHHHTCNARRDCHQARPGFFDSVASIFNRCNFHKHPKFQRASWPRRPYQRRATGCIKLLEIGPQVPDVGFGVLASSCDAVVLGATRRGVDCGGGGRTGENGGGGRRGKGERGSEGAYARNLRGERSV